MKVIVMRTVQLFSLATAHRFGTSRTQDMSKDYIVEASLAVARHFYNTQSEISYLRNYPRYLPRSVSDDTELRHHKAPDLFEQKDEYPTHFKVSLLQ